MDITGSFSMTLTTPDQRLNAEVSAGSSTPVTLVVTNTGTAPLSGVTVTASPPQGWQVTFEPDGPADLAPSTPHDGGGDHPPIGLARWPATTW